MNLMQPQFTQSEVLEAIPALDAATLQNWANRRVVIPASEHVGRNSGARLRGVRLYSGEDVIWLALLKALTDFLEGRVPVGMAATFCPFDKIRSGLRQNGGKLPFIGLVTVPAYNREQCEQGANAYARYIAEVKTSDQLMKGMVSQMENGEPVLFLPTEVIETRTHAKLEEIVSRRPAEVEA
jgi:hypothetical protein